ncbi:tetratricopeptide repeat protein [Bradyrhizobium sp. R2.2-H]|uniref:tetratricopeptide repeat protein n=1 Tax=unclassified Bradyrhizobium TaxID=2631580 RepID=UPI001044DE0B|nr:MULTISPECIES: tetratricopeptide repeat protein [unclassified Bradyrhizobium]TCU73609.1 tetratricopeptide repeat protein [Bradyrhizobium sp. Y-H1]TCU76201.1 tetratricopeptide repeat protein [Bradyrhizobium sp. R2.2-H]
MAVRFPHPRTLCLALVLAAVGLAPALAQQIEPPGKQKKLPEAPAKLPKVERGKNLDFLFGALKAAPDEASAKHVEARIWAIWLQTPSDTAALLMSRAKTAVDAKKIDVAIKLLDSVIKLRPDYIEAWNRRATLYYMQNDYGRALADVQQVLIREPRHFGALAGLGMIMQEIGDEKRALDAYRKALAVNPHLEKIPDQVKALTEKVEGRDI